MKIKICGLMRDEDVDAVNIYMPDYVGFVFAGEKRRLTWEQAARLKERLDKRITAVGVFVNAKPHDIERLCREKIIDVVQLHGDEDAEYISEIKKHVTNPIIKAVRVKDSRQVIEVIEAFKLTADYFLFDSYVENMYGGSGKAFDYNVLTKAFKAVINNNLYNISSEMPKDANISEEICTTNYQAMPKEVSINKLEMKQLIYFLAGGINIYNIGEIMNSINKLKYKPLCLDISSGVETNGRKDIEKIKEIITKIRFST